MRHRQPQLTLKEDTGQISVLVLGMVSIVLMFSTVILGVTTVNLQARHLLSAADGAASAAAASAQPAGAQPGISQHQVRAAAEQHLAETGAHERHPGLTVMSTGTSEGGETVHIQLRAEAELPVLRWVLPEAVEVTAESSARIAVGR